ncbi:hypothetical protein [Ferrimonas marina]|uniref:Uncharacterized protein n=1 Tax=Ferrimonas marina TaxID=299255 RepID=A0A1M5NFV7_9GAMM|nr:hypothetical protein [Ferrimonas marina]SHG87843.1 hypothetical protein SAMN02745129_1017 [Ferrimonas marina]
MVESQLGTTLVLLLCIVITLVVSIGIYLKSFLEHRFNQLAQRHELDALTLETQRGLQLLNRENGHIVERLGNLSQMSSEVLTERMKAHQQAYHMWYQTLQLLRESSKRRQRKEAKRHFDDCEAFWQAHCLYLDEEARMAFRQSYQFTTGASLG